MEEISCQECDLLAIELYRLGRLRHSLLLDREQSVRLVSWTLTLDRLRYRVTFQHQRSRPWSIMLYCTHLAMLRLYGLIIVSSSSNKLDLILLSVTDGFLHTLI